MNFGLILATTNVLLSIGSCVGYACTRDWKRAAYWAAGATITAVVTYMKDK